MIMMMVMIMMSVDDNKYGETSWSLASRIDYMNNMYPIEIHPLISLWLKRITCLHTFPVFVCISNQ